MASVRKHIVVLLVGVICPCIVNAVWKMENVFEAFSYGPSNAHALFTGNDVSPDRSTLGERQHFKHPIVNDWDKINISRVEIQIIKNGTGVAYVTFNGHQSSRTSWMSIENILDSSYSDVTYSSLKRHVDNNGYYFSVDGIRLQNGHRRFYMNKLFRGCPDDIGWMFLVEGVPVCNYERGRKTPYDYALVGYVPSTLASNLQSHVDFADSMRILLEYESLATTPPETTSLSAYTTTTEQTTTDTTATTTEPMTTKTTTTTPELMSTKTETASTTTESMSTKTETASKTTESMTAKTESTSTTTAPMSTKTETTIPRSEISTIAISEKTLISEPTTKQASDIIKPFQDSNCTGCNCEAIDANLSLSELKVMIKQLQEKLKVDKSKLSKTIGRLNSAQDPRSSSIAVGVMIGGTIFGLVFAAIVLPDVISLLRFLYSTLQTQRHN